MTIVIRPRRVHWPSLFWRRAEGSYAGCDLLCRQCGGRGTSHVADLDGRDVTVEEAACPCCRASGLLVPARDHPGDIESLRAAEEAGGCWLDWLGHTADGLMWPESWCWTVSRKRFAIRRDVYVGGRDVLAFMADGSVVAGLFTSAGGGGRALTAVFRLACGEDAEPPVFLTP